MKPEIIFENSDEYYGWIVEYDNEVFEVTSERGAISLAVSLDESFTAQFS